MSLEELQFFEAYFQRFRAKNLEIRAIVNKTTILSANLDFYPQKFTGLGEDEEDQSFRTKRDKTPFTVTQRFSEIAFPGNWIWDGKC